MRVTFQNSDPDVSPRVRGLERDARGEGCEWGEKAWNIDVSAGPVLSRTCARENASQESGMEGFGA